MRECLAVEITKMGDARSIRRSEIPAHVFAQFVKPGENTDIARRDLVAACFLERKEPDLLTFGHKSFLEFLVASRIVSLIKLSDSDIESSLVAATSEIGSFVIDLSTSEDIIRVLGERDGSSKNL